MSIGRLLGIGLVVVLLVPTAIAAQQQATTNFQSFVIEDFDDPEESPWIVNAGQFTAEGFPRTAYVNTWPQALYREQPEGETLQVLGVQGAFTRMGYNFIEFIPVEDPDAEEPETRPIPIPGMVQNLDMWVWGSNFDYYIEVHIRDFRGMVHVLDLGDIDFPGWRNMRIPIPNYVPQSSRYLAEVREGEYNSDLRSLELMKIVLWTKPTERVNGFFVYFDELKVETDMYRPPFDGEELRDPEFVRQVWDNLGENGNGENGEGEGNN